MAEEKIGGYRTQVLADGTTIVTVLKWSYCDCAHCGKAIPTILYGMNSWAVVKDTVSYEWLCPYCHQWTVQETGKPAPIEFDPRRPNETENTRMIEICDEWLANNS